jgi:polyphenol oxidase
MLLQAPKLSLRKGVIHGFTTRRGGVSTGSLSTLNLALRAHESTDNVMENWNRVVRSMDPGLDVDGVALLHQVHGATVVDVRAGAGPLEVVAEADGAVTDQPAVVLAVRVADCVPVVLVADGAVGVAHAGWRGVAQGVIAATVRRLRALAEPGSDVWAAIGPHIGGDVFEVGPEVVDALEAAGLAPERFVVRRRGDRAYVDLGVAASDQLAAAGVALVERVGACSLTDDGLFSHRGDGPETGRMAGVVAMVST